MERLPDYANRRHTFVYIYLLCFLLCLLFFAYVIGFSVVSGDSMYKTLFDGEIIAVRKAFYGIERYDIVIVSGVSGGHAVKRVVGLPGETVSIYNNTVFIDGLPLGGESVSRNGCSWVLGNDEYFLMGDNRGGSYDSRDYGAVGRNNIKGVVIVKHGK